MAKFLVLAIEALGLRDVHSLCVLGNWALCMLSYGIGLGRRVRMRGAARARAAGSAQVLSVSLSG